MTDSLAPFAPEEITEIERLEREATPGPWATAVVDGLAGFRWPAEERGRVVISRRLQAHDHELVVTLRNAAPRLLTSARREVELGELARKVIQTYSSADRCVLVDRQAYEALWSFLKAQGALVRVGQEENGGQGA